jgi:hypothetical protein
MLKPYVCVACEKVILTADGIASLINIFGKLTITVPADTEIPSNAVAPKEWIVFSIFDFDPGDELKEFTYCVKIMYPDDTQFGDISKTRLNLEAGKHRATVNVQVPAFPLSQVGKYTIYNWIEENQQVVVGPIEFKIELEIIRPVQKAPS